MGHPNGSALQCCVSAMSNRSSPWLQSPPSSALCVVARLQRCGNKWGGRRGCKTNKIGRWRTAGGTIRPPVPDRWLVEIQLDLSLTCELIWGSEFPFSVRFLERCYLPATYSSTGQGVLQITDALKFFTAGMILDRPATPATILNSPVSGSPVIQGIAAAFRVDHSSGGGPESERARDSRSYGDRTGEKSMEGKIAFVQLEGSDSL